MNTLSWNRRRYTAYAPIYDLLVRPLERDRRRSIEALQIRSGEQVLLLGVGTGADLPLLPRDAQLTAVDLTPAMLRRSVARGGRLEQPISAAVMNAQQLGFGSALFDVVILHLVLAVVPDPLACIREAARVLRPDGRIGILDKFLPKAARPSWQRRALNVVTTSLFSTINRKLEPLLAAADLALRHDEPGALGGAYRIAIAAKR